MVQQGAARPATTTRIFLHCLHRETPLACVGCTCNLVCTVLLVHRYVNYPCPTQVDNPDQRIGEDISTFTQDCISVLVVSVGSVLKVGSFIGVLLSISRTLTVFVTVYSIVGTVLTTYMFGARMKHLIFEGAKREANFR